MARRLPELVAEVAAHSDLKVGPPFAPAGCAVQVDLLGPLLG